MEYSDVRYLLAKQPVDDRALSRPVLESFGAALRERDCPKLVEIGAGVGTMVCRLVEWGVASDLSYTLVERDHTSVEAARAHLLDWADSFEERPERGSDDPRLDGSSSLSPAATPVGPPVELRRGGARVQLQCVHADALALLAAPAWRDRFDGVVANAVLDLMELQPAFRSIWNAVKPEGLYWFTINFDGETIFTPALPDDEAVFRLYHRTMDERIIDGRPAGHSRTGRMLVTELPRSGARIEAAGSSAWVVHPRQAQAPEAEYPGDERYFLQHILHTVETAVGPLVAAGAEASLSSAAFERWVQERFRQIEAGRLGYIAHQLDYFGRAPR